VSSRELVLFLMVVAGAGAVTRWRRAIEWAMVCLVVEGALRKWLFPGAQDLLYFLKDVILLGAYVGFLVDPKRPRHGNLIPFPLTAATIASLAFGALQIFNEDLPSPFVGLLGFKAYFFYMPLLWLVPAAFTTAQDLRDFVRRQILLCAAVGVLAVLQFVSPPESPLNAYARLDRGMPTTFGSSTHVRVTGTFSYITGFASYLLVMIFWMLGHLAATRWRLRSNAVVLAALGLSVLGIVMSGSRGPLLNLLPLIPLYVWLGLARNRDFDRVLPRLLVAGVVLSVVLGYSGTTAIEALTERAHAAGDMHSRLLSPFLTPLEALDVAGLYGVGIGSTHQAAVAVTPDIEPFAWLRGHMLEEETGRVMLELGPIGFMLVYFPRVALIFFALSSALHLRTRFGRAFATSCVLFFASHLLTSVVFNVTIDVYYWFWAGMLFLLARLDAEAPAAEIESFGPPPLPRPLSTWTNETWRKWPPRRSS
jgi:hypothetical protein